jgi:type II secretory pathway pseudopilin PulG
VLARVRVEKGFGLIELLMAMTMLNIGILAIVAAFNSGIVSLNRAGKLSTASALGDAQMELYRALTYDQIRLDPTSIPGSGSYTTDPAYSASQVTTPTCTGLPNECNASRSLTGPDRHSYRIDTYIVTENPTAASRQLKRVTVVVRDGLKLSGKPLVRETSTFDCSTGQPYASCPTS